MTSPTLLVDKDKVVCNVKRMSAKAKRGHIVFRPHFKTHRSATIGEWLRELGVEKITVSSMAMAAYFAAHGWNDITVAFPLNPREFDAVNLLTSRISLNVTISGDETAELLARSAVDSVGYFIEIDTGYNRTGIDAGKLPLIQTVIDTLGSSHHAFRGFLVHAGDTYSAASPEEIIGIYRRNVNLLGRLGETFKHFSDDLILSYGDTPSCSLVDEFEVISELRPGNFVFYDIMQHRLGACELNDIAVALACPVVAINRARRQVVVHGGAVHLSKDFIVRDDGKRNYGEVVALDPKRWRPEQSLGYVSSLSQEHGVIAATDEFLESAAIGDIVAVLPIHSCLTADSMNGYVDLKGHTIAQQPKNVLSGSGDHLSGANTIECEELLKRCT